MHGRLSLPARALLSALALVGALASAPAARADLPAPAAALIPQARESGQGKLTWFGLHIYDARLYVSGSAWQPDAPFALSLTYARDVGGARIAETSIDEMRRLGFGSEADQKRWRERMLALFPDVKRGDDLVGVSLPGRGAVFIHNSRRLGEIDEPEFARAFFAIWLDSRTRDTALRSRLLGGAG